jgi:hypothetical protein
MKHNSFNRRTATGGPQQAGNNHRISKRTFAVIIMAATISVLIGIGCKKSDLQASEDMNNQVVNYKLRDSVRFYSSANERLTFFASDKFGNPLPPRQSTTSVLCDGVSLGDYEANFTGTQVDIPGSTVYIAFNYDVWVPANYTPSSSNIGTVKIPANAPFAGATLTGPLLFNLLESDVYHPTFGENANHYTVSFSVQMTKTNYCNYYSYQS